MVNTYSSYLLEHKSNVEGKLRQILDLEVLSHNLIVPLHIGLVLGMECRHLCIPFHSIHWWCYFVLRKIQNMTKPKVSKRTSLWRFLWINMKKCVSDSFLSYKHRRKVQYSILVLFYLSKFTWKRWAYFSIILTISYKIVM